MTRKDTLHHTWHPNTFGLLYGLTTRTACGRRRKTSDIVRQPDTDCPGCQDTVTADQLLQVQLVIAARQGHYHDPSGKYDYCTDPACPRRQVIDALAGELAELAWHWADGDAESLAAAARIMARTPYLGTPAGGDGDGKAAD